MNLSFKSSNFNGETARINNHITFYFRNSTSNCKSAFVFQLSWILLWLWLFPWLLFYPVFTAKGPCVLLTSSHQSPVQMCSSCTWTERSFGPTHYHDYAHPASPGTALLSASKLACRYIQMSCMFVSCTIQATAQDGRHTVARSLECQQINALRLFTCTTPRTTRHKHTVPRIFLAQKKQSKTNTHPAHRHSYMHTLRQAHTLTYILQEFCSSWHHNYKESSWPLKPSDFQYYYLQNLLFPLGCCSLMWQQ